MGQISPSTDSQKQSHSASTTLKVGEKAPNFTLVAASGEQVSLKDFLGKKYVVLYFYPKDNTPGCTTEACTFRDHYDELGDLDAEVIGISSDSSASHQSFTSRYHLPFPLLTDPGSRVRKLYGVSATLGLLPGRTTFILDKTGVILHIFSAQFAPKQHIVEALRVLRERN